MNLTSALPVVFAGLSCFGVSLLRAQRVPPLAYYSFDDGSADDTQGNDAYDGFLSGQTLQGCGPSGNSILLDGLASNVTFAGPLSDVFQNGDFVVSLYFHPTGTATRQTLLSKQEDCAEYDRVFRVVYLAREKALQLDFAENASKRIGGEDPEELVPLDSNACWQHLVVARVASKVSVYVNGDLSKTFNSGSRFNISNDFPLQIGASSCPLSESNFQGFIDEFQVYQGGISGDNIEALYLNNERVVPDSKQQVINAGEQTEIQLGNTCATDISWAPNGSIVAGANTDNPRVAPDTSTRYAVSLTYDQSPCVATDIAAVQVFNTDGFDCTQLLLPRAFTPNGLGPADNETFGISNSNTLQNFARFEIYDRWGNRVFGSGVATDRWDGTYEGEPSAPGMYLWRVAFECDGEAIDKAGELTLIR